MPMSVRICHASSFSICGSADSGPFAVVLVGAMNVGSIGTPWTGELRPVKRGVVVDYDLSGSDVSKDVAKGDLLGWFNMGSTVIVLVPDGAGDWTDKLTIGTTLRMGEVIGQR